MKNDDEKKKPSLVERHALDRLDEVEKDKRKAYTKPDADLRRPRRHYQSLRRSAADGAAPAGTRRPSGVDYPS